MLRTISILTPARKRPENILKMLESIKATQSKNHNIEVIFRADSSDEILGEEKFRMEMFSLIDTRLYINLLYGPETFPDLGILWNDCYQKSHGDILMCGGDDLVFETQNWDEKVIEAFNKYPDEIALVWGPDGAFAAQLATHPIVSRKWVETLGWFFPPIGLTYANDNFLYNLANRLNRLHFISDLSIRHQWIGSGTSDPNRDRMLSYFDKSHEILSGHIGQDCMKDAEMKLRSVMK